MKPSYSLIAQYLTVGLLLLGSCSKNQEQLSPATPTPITGQEDVRVLQQAFLDKHLAQQLVFPLKDHTTRSWMPRWDQTFQRVSSATKTDTYVPLELPALLWIGVKKYLLIQHVADKVEYSEASYTFREEKNKLKDAANPLDFLAAFTGTLRIKNLATGVNSFFFYKNGVQQSTPAANGKSSQNANAARSCYNVVTCRWDGYCTLTDQNYAHYGTETSGVDYCDTPQPDGVGCSQIQWSLTASNSQSFCDGNGGTGGGSGGTSGANSVLSINTNNLKPCATAVLSTLETLSGNPLLTNLQKLAGNASGYNWTVKDGNLSGTNQTGFTSAGYDVSTNSAVTIFDTQKFPKATDLSFARTLLHESFHAYLVVYFANDRTLANVQYSALVDAYQVQHQDINDIHHVEMAFWVGNIYDALKQYGQSKGYNLPDQFYYDMAWAGLEGTQAYKDLPNADKRRIQDTILTELTGMDGMGNSVPQSGKSPGC